MVDAGWVTGEAEGNEFWMRERTEHNRRRIIKRGRSVESERDAYMSRKLHKGLS